MRIGTTINTFRFFKNSSLFLAAGLALSVFIGAWDRSRGGSSLTSASAVRAGLEAGFIALVLAALEVSLSFDNAIVNASVLRNMSARWRHRFLTWGMLIAVFLMRLVFPLAIVSVIAQLNPLAALRLAVFDAAGYAEVMRQAHLPVSVFGGTFLLLVATRFFFNDEREGLWFKPFERRIAAFGRFRFSYLLVTGAVVLIASIQVSQPQRFVFFATSGLALLTYQLIHGLSTLLAHPHQPIETSVPASGTRSSDLQRASAGMFIYLEVLDASFSFDGVVGAFAITNHLLIITIGLSIGAMFVRSLTLMLVEKRSLTEFIYLEAGAFYAVAVLGIILFLNLFVEIPETVTGLSGLVIIGAAWFSSHRHNLRRAAHG